MSVLLNSQQTKYSSLLEGNSSNETESGGVLTPLQMSSAAPDVESPLARWPSRIDKGAFLFALRMAIILTIGSLFVLIRAPGDDGKGYPQGMWVLVTMLFVSWFPRLDAASVIEKSIQRLMGTFIGASIGLGCGFTSMAFENNASQAAFLGFCVFIVTFGVVFTSGNFRLGPTKIMAKKGYATVICLLTFSIAILPFYSDEEPRWRKGVWRVLNVILGCILGAICSVVIFPRSTTSILREKVEKQVQLAGESSEAVLHAAADAFSGHLNPLALADELLETPAHRRNRIRMSLHAVSYRSVNKRVVKEDGDRTLTMYVDAISDWKAAKALYPVMPYDPFHWFSASVSEEQRAELKMCTARILAQTLRIQTMIVCLDGVIRNDMPGYEFDDDQLDFFAQVGTLIRSMLTLPFNESKSGSAASLVAEKLAEVRSHIREISSTVSGGTGSVEAARKAHHMYTPVFDSVFQGASDVDDEVGEGPTIGNKCDGAVFPCTASCVLLFLQLVEQLMLRSLRLYHTWKKATTQMDQLAPQKA